MVRAIQLSKLPRAKDPAAEKFPREHSISTKKDGKILAEAMC